MKDDIFKRPAPHLVDFEFNQRVVDVFPDMIRRSVPGYETVVPIAGLLGAQEMSEGDVAYDLGCSLGATTGAFLAQLGSLPCVINAVDASVPMLAKARQLIADERVSFIERDVREMQFETCKVVFSNWLLQFIPPEERLTLLTRLRRAMRPDGLLILSEKLRLEDQDLQRYYVNSHEAFKAANGYSAMEISQKRSALENVMIIDTETAHRARLAAAGFSRVEAWFRCLNWISFLVRP